MVPFGILALKGLCTGHDVRGPHRDGPLMGTELKLFGCWLLHGLHNGGGGNGPCNKDVIDGPCASIGMCGGIELDPGPCPWWHIGPPQFGIAHCPPLFIPPLLQYGSTMKLSWLPEHFINLDDVRGGDDCREWILFYFFLSFLFCIVEINIFFAIFFPFFSLTTIDCLCVKCYLCFNLRLVD